MLIEDFFSLEGKVAVAIGAGGVLAGEMARGFAGAGAKVVIVDLSRENAEARAREICDGGGIAISAVADVTSKDDLRSALATTLDNFGQVDILLNAAGINSG